MDMRIIRQIIQYIFGYWGGGGGEGGGPSLITLKENWEINSDFYLQIFWETEGKWGKIMYSNICIALCG